MFDWRELRRWGIDERRLPKGSVVLFRAGRDFWADHKWEVAGVAGVLLGQGLLIGALLVERRSRRRAQTGLVEAERRYRTVADFTTDWEYWTRPDGSFAYVSPSCLAITGYDAAAFTSRPALLTDIIVDEDRASWAAHRHARRRRPRRRSGWNSAFARRRARPAGSTTSARRSSARTAPTWASAARTATSREKAVGGRPAARLRGDPAAARPARGRQHLHAGAVAAGRRHRGPSRDQRRHAVRRVQGAAGGAHVEHRAAAGRDRRRQGSRRAGDSRREPPPGPPARHAELRGAASVPHRERAVRARERGVHRRPRLSGAAGSRSPTTARCSSTRSANCRSTCRPSCCAPSRTANSSASGAT